MGFLLRIGFWLAVAVAIMPNEDRPGSESVETASTQSLEQAVRMTAYSAYSLFVRFQQSCDTNPELCRAAGQLADTAMATGQTIVSEFQNGVLEAKPVGPGTDGRVAKFQDRAE